MVSDKILQKRSAAPAPVVIESKRANIRNTMKAVRPERSTTLATSTFRCKVTATAVNVSAPLKVNTVGPKPRKWNLKHCLEYTRNESSALKPKHIEVLLRYMSV